MDQDFKEFVGSSSLTGAAVSRDLEGRRALRRRGLETELGPGPGAL